MKRLIVNGNEIEIDKSSLVPLTEEELEHAHGGIGENGRLYSRIVCIDCGFASRWGVSAKEETYIINFHYSLTSHYQFKTEQGYFTSDPNESTTG